MKTIKIEGWQSVEDLEMQLGPAAQMLREGSLVAFPTETVYGLGANALIPEAVLAVYQSKGRPSDNPMILHVSTVDDIRDITSQWTELAAKLAEAFMPGPFTLILKKGEAVSSAVSGGLETVAVRIPNHPIARTLIRLAGVPVAAPSANRSGRPSPTRAEHVRADFGNGIACLVDGGATRFGLESTVLDVSDEDAPQILRPGSITYEMIAEFLEKNWSFESSTWRETLKGEAGIAEQDKITDQRFVARSPGMKYRHYAPDAKLYIIEGDLKTAREKILTEQPGAKVFFFVSQEAAEELSLSSAVEKKIFGSRHNPDLAAHDLYAALRDFDAAGADVIVAEALPQSQVGSAYMNRLMKAADVLVQSNQVTELKRSD